jgi:hypothetical protein
LNLLYFNILPTDIPQPVNSITDSFTPTFKNVESSIQRCKTLLADTGVVGLIEAG